MCDWAIEDAKGCESEIVEQDSCLRRETLIVHVSRCDFAIGMALEKRVNVSGLFVGGCACSWRKKGMFYVWLLHKGVGKGA